MKFDLQPTLTGKLLELKPIMASDFEDLFAAASDPLIWEQHPIKDRYKREVFAMSFERLLQSKDALKVIDKSTGKIIGASRFYDFDAEKSEIVIGHTFLSRKYWGGLHNKEMKSLMLDHAFKFVKHVNFHVDRFNLRSQKAMLKIGAVEHDRIEKTYPETGPRQMIVYRISAAIHN